MRSHRLLTVLLVAIAAAVVAAFALTITRGNDRDRDTSPAGAGPQAPVPSSGTWDPTSVPPGIDLFGNRLEVPARESGVATTQDSAGRVDPSRPDYLTTPPAGLRWQRAWGGAAIPVSSSDGPTNITDGIASRFARTPQGAAMAAADALARALAAPDGVWQRVVRERYYGGGDALTTRFARSRERTRDAARYVVVPDGVRIRPGYSPDLAVVEFAARDDLGYRIATWPMAWVDGDWRVRVPDNLESLWGPGAYAADMSGFGSWKSTS